MGKHSNVIQPLVTQDDGTHNKNQKENTPARFLFLFSHAEAPFSGVPSSKLNPTDWL